MNDFKIKHSSIVDFSILKNEPKKHQNQPGKTSTEIQKFWTTNISICICDKLYKKHNDIKMKWILMFQCHIWLRLLTFDQFYPTEESNKKSVIKLKICFWLYFQFMISLQYFYAYFSCSSMIKIKTIKKSSTCPYYYDFLIWWKTRRAPKCQIYLR